MKNWLKNNLYRIIENALVISALVGAIWWLLSELPQLKEKVEREMVADSIRRNPQPDTSEWLQGGEIKR